jgi:two-component system, probable response regulator PhcQ
MQHKVLIVDDDMALRDMMKEAFAREPYEVSIAGSANEALGLLAQNPADVVISDEIMPGLSGSEFLAIVRKKYPKTIRMILTGHANLESAIRAINEGEIYRFFTKPCNMIDLAITVRQALQHNAAINESQHLKKVVAQQSAIIDDIEQKHPGISSVKRTSGGAIIIDG